MIEAIEQYYDVEILKADGFDDAIIGIEENDMRLIYSVSKCLKILELEMTEIDALEYFIFNVSGAYVGEKTPIWCWDNFASECLPEQAQDLNMGYKPKKIELDLESMASNEVNLNCNIKGLK